MKTASEGVTAGHSSPLPIGNSRMAPAVLAGPSAPDPKMDGLTWVHCYEVVDGSYDNGDRGRGRNGGCYGNASELLCLDGHC